MYLLYCDETNLNPQAGDFLIYGGLLVDGAVARDLSRAVDRIRNDAQVARDFQLKFNPGPANLRHHDFIAAKQALLQLCAEFNVKLFAYVVLHDLAVDHHLARRNGINSVCYHFHCALNRLDSPGLVLIDRFNDDGNEIEAHLRDKFSVGLTGMPYAGEMRLENIVGFHYSAIGQSHVPSLIDIVLGSLRFAINAHTRNNENHFETAQRLLELLSPLFWREDAGGPVPEIGFLFSPKIVKSDRYRAKYAALKDFLEANGLATSQVITNERRY